MQLIVNLPTHSYNSQGVWRSAAKERVDFLRNFIFIIEYLPQ